MSAEPTMARPRTWADLAAEPLRLPADPAPSEVLPSPAEPDVPADPLVAPDVERALLGGVILVPADLPALVLDPDDFAQQQNAALFALLREMTAAGEPIDMVTVPERVLRDGLGGRRFGGVGYVVSLVDGVPPGANLAYYAGLLRRKAERRRLVEQLGNVVDALRADQDCDGALVDAAGALLAVARPKRDDLVELFRRTVPRAGAS